MDAEVLRNGLDDMLDVVKALAHRCKKGEKDLDGLLKLGQAIYDKAITTKEGNSNGKEHEGHESHEANHVQKPA